MLESQLAMEFGKRYRAAEKGLVVTTIHLFAIEFADELSGHSLKEICRAADVPESYYTELHKGIRLAAFVRLK